MELKYTNPNGGIVLAKKLNHMELSFLKNCKNCIQKWTLRVIFLGRCSKCPKNKIVHNFLVTNPNGMNKSFPDRKIYNIWGKKILIQFFSIFFCCPFSPVLSFCGHNFCFRAPIEKKIIFPQSLSIFLSSKKVSKNQGKNSARRFLPEISFVPWRNNGLLGVKLVSLFSFVCLICSNLTKYKVSDGILDTTQKLFAKRSDYTDFILRRLDKWCESYWISKFFMNRNLN